MCLRELKQNKVFLVFKKILAAVYRYFENESSCWLDFPYFFASLI